MHMYYICTMCLADLPVEQDVDHHHEEAAPPVPFGVAPLSPERYFFGPFSMNAFWTLRTSGYQSLSETAARVLSGPIPSILAYWRPHDPAPLPQIKILGPSE